MERVIRLRARGFVSRDRARADENPIKPADSPAACRQPHRFVLDCRCKRHRKLMCGQPLGTFLPDRGGPPRETPLRQPLLAEPEPLAVVHEHLERSGPAITEDENCSGEGIVFEMFLAEPREGVDASTEIGRLDCHEDLHRRGDLKHQGTF